MKTARRRSAPSVSERGRSVAAIASSRQCGGGATSLRGCDRDPLGLVAPDPVRERVSHARPRRARPDAAVSPSDTPSSAARTSAPIVATS